jgi:hypothetical protein
MCIVSDFDIFLIFIIRHTVFIELYIKRYGFTLGGIAGYIDGSYFDFVNITNSGNVIARDKNVSYLGGLVGKLVGAYSSYNDTRSILKGYMEGNVIGYSDVGGLIGHADAADVMGYMIGKVVIQAGDFGGENIGGLVGKLGTRTESGILKGYMSGVFIPFLKIHMFLERENLYHS